MRQKLFRIIIAIFILILPLFVIYQTRPVKAQTPAGFNDVTVFSGLINPTAIRFAKDGRIFVAEKRGIIKVFDNEQDTSPTVFADLRTNVYNFWDRGLLSMALHPNFPQTPYIYVMYTHDALIGGTAPKWGSANGDSDPCPSPPGPTGDGCVVSGRISRLEANGSVMTGSEKVLVEDYCQQYPSHSTGTIAFGSDGALYASGGDGASFNFADYGQDGNPVNPCGDPPGGIGGAMTPPTAEGGALRSQDLQTGGDPVSLDGTVIRINPDTGEALPDNPLFSNPDPNAKRIIAYGLRNPFRFAIRPGTNEVWVGDVGWSAWEEINRIQNPTDATVENFGWPCYEGNGKQPSYDGLNLNICENLYSQNSVTAPYLAINHNTQVVPGETCSVGSSSIAGLAFQFYTDGPYPEEYDGALFFADYSRNCIWAIKKGTNDLPDLSKLENFVTGAKSPVDVQISPNGELYYADFNGGTIRKITYGGQGTPTPTPTPEGGKPTAVIDTPLPTRTWKVGDTISFSGSATDPEDGNLQASKLKWDLIMHHCPLNCHTHSVQSFEGVQNGSFKAPDHEYPSHLELRLTATDSQGNTGTKSIMLNPKTVNLTFRTSPLGFTIVTGADSSSTPFSKRVIVGSSNTVSATSPQTLNGRQYKFFSWSSGSDQTHTIIAPDTDQTYTAKYFTNGLNATYFNNTDFTGTKFRRVDSNINFNWGTGSPISGIDNNTFSVRWAGYINPVSTGKYTFYAKTDDGVRVWVNNQLIINKWVTQSAKEWSGSINLTKGNKYRIKVEYFDGAGAAMAELRWSTPSIQKKIIPQARFTTN